MIRIKTLIVILLIIIGISPKVSGQIIKGEALLGFNLTQVEGDEVHGFKKPGLNIGAGVLIPFKKNWDISMEVIFNQKGARQKPQYTDSLSNGHVITGEYKLRLNYVEVPLMVFLYRQRIY